MIEFFARMVAIFQHECIDPLLSQLPAADRLSWQMAIMMFVGIIGGSSISFVIKKLARWYVDWRYPVAESAVEQPETSHSSVKFQQKSQLWKCEQSFEVSQRLKDCLDTLEVFGYTGKHMMQVGAAALTALKDTQMDRPDEKICLGVISMTKGDVITRLRGMGDLPE